MSENKLHITDEMSELIALEMMLGEDIDSQNLMDMEAKLMFNSPDDATMSLDREAELLCKLNEALKRGGFWNKWIHYIIGAVFVISSVLFFLIKGTDSNSLVSENKPAQNNNLILISKGKKDFDSIENQNKSGFLIAEKMQKDSVADTVGVSKKHKQSDMTTFDGGVKVPEMRQPKSRFNEADYYPVKEPIFNDFKYSFSDFQKKKAEFKLVLTFYRSIHLEQENAELTYYIGKPLKKDPQDLVYINYGEFAQKEFDFEKNIWAASKWVLGKDGKAVHKEPAKDDDVIRPQNPKIFVPYSVRMHIDTSDVVVDSNRLIYEKISNSVLENCIAPFYFRKYEVTNKEYFEFVNWVRLANGFDSKVIDGKDFSKAYTYTFFSPTNQIKQEIGTNTLNIYPDTACWTRDFVNSYNEPLANSYSWHPAYENYPVVGVSYWQALAYLDWKTHFHQKELDGLGINYIVEYALPNDIEWELASIMYNENENIAFANMDIRDADWLTDLMINNKNTREVRNYLKIMLNRNTYNAGNLFTDGVIYTGLANLTQFNNTFKNFPIMKLHLTSTGISWMDGNVSEWIRENYTDNWSPIYAKHIQMMQKQTGLDAILSKSIEDYFNAYNTLNGQLVRGANWFDERFSSKAIGNTGACLNTVNSAGINAKRFINPNEQHSTVGFRYVVKFEIVD